MRRYRSLLFVHENPKHGLLGAQFQTGDGSQTAIRVGHDGDRRELAWSLANDRARPMTGLRASTATHVCQQLAAASHHRMPPGELVIACAVESSGTAAIMTDALSRILVEALLAGEPNESWLLATWSKALHEATAPMRAAADARLNGRG